MITIINEIEHPQTPESNKMVQDEISKIQAVINKIDNDTISAIITISGKITNNGNVEYSIIIESENESHKDNILAAIYG